MKSTFKAGLALAAVCGAVLANPAFGAGEAATVTRSAMALPMLAAAVGSVRYTPGVENTWQCVKVVDEALKIDGYFHVDEAGRVVVDPKDAPFSCRPVGVGPEGGSGGGGFPIEIALGVAGAVGGGVALASGGGGNDSTG